MLLIRDSVPAQLGLDVQESAALRGRDPFELWSSLELPDLVVV